MRSTFLSCDQAVKSDCVIVLTDYIITQLSAGFSVVFCVHMILLETQPEEVPTKSSSAFKRLVEFQGHRSLKCVQRFQLMKRAARCSSCACECSGLTCSAQGPLRWHAAAVRLQADRSGFLERWEQQQQLPHLSAGWLEKPQLCVWQQQKEGEMVRMEGETEGRTEAEENQVRSYSVDPGWKHHLLRCEARNTRIISLLSSHLFPSDSLTPHHTLLPFSDPPLIFQGRKYFPKYSDCVCCHLVDKLLIINFLHQPNDFL